MSQCTQTPPFSLLRRFPSVPLLHMSLSSCWEDTCSCTMIRMSHEDPQSSSLGTITRISLGGGPCVSGVCRLHSANTVSWFFVDKAVGTPPFPMNTVSIWSSSSHPSAAGVAETQYDLNLLFPNYGEARHHFLFSLVTLVSPGTHCSFRSSAPFSIAATFPS